MARSVLFVLMFVLPVIALSACGEGSEEPVPGETITLPAPSTTGDMSLEETLQLRRSVRQHTDESLTVQQVSQLLWAAQGVTQEGGKRTAPSAGALYPLEVHLVARNVDGLEPGVYTFHPNEHQIVGRVEGDLMPRLAEVALGQMWIAEAPAAFVISGVYERTTGKYTTRGERYVHIEAGHAAQNLMLQATALSLGGTTVGAFADGEVSDILKLPEEEEPLYILPIGHVAG